MATLLLCCVAPLQSWDSQSRFSIRTTGREPSKSGIIGLICAALGRPRTAPITDLAALRLGVRVDKEGSLLRDFHTAKDVLKAGGGGTKDTEISTRYYLNDAAFLVGLEGDKPLLQLIHAALQNPYWLLCLGRKACPPSLSPYLPDGLHDESLRDALKDYPWLGSQRYQYNKLEQLRLVLDDDTGPQVRHDHPISFEKGKRQFAPRRVSTHFIEKPPFTPDPKGL